jgi:diguanylate cyclase (GGDEF)-like protein
VAIPLDASFAVLVATEQRAIFSGSAAQPVFGSLDVRDTLVNGSYVGVPLQLSDTTAIGSLCAVARPTRRYTEQDLQLLTVMARLLAHEVESDRKQRELRQQAEEYREHATTDPLTGVMNRRGFLESLNKEWQLSRRGTVVSYLVVADVDGLKATNDRFGHASGDALLEDVARALTGAARVSDTVGRLGGDEFGVVLIGCDGEEDAAAFRVRAAERLTSLARDRPRPVALSFGSHSLADARSPARALALADRAMYEDKTERKSARDPAQASTAPST